MNLETLLEMKKGMWANGGAIVLGPGGYFYKVAVGTPESYELTPDAALFGIELANMSADVVLSEEPKKRPRKPKVDVVPDIELDI